MWLFHKLSTSKALNSAIPAGIAAMLRLNVYINDNECLHVILLWDNVRRVMARDCTERMAFHKQTGGVHAYQRVRSQRSSTVLCRHIPPRGHSRHACLIDQTPFRK